MRSHLLLGLAAVAAHAQGDGSVRVVADNELDLSYIPLNTSQAVSTPFDLVSKSCPEFFTKQQDPAPQIVFSTFDHLDANSRFEEGTMYPSSSSFIRGSIEAWGRHQHLFIRPDEVWFEILAQLSFFMKKNAESVRDLFVAHQGQETIDLVNVGSGAELISGFAKAIDKKVKTPWLKDWIKPGFSVSTEHDDLTAQAFMMGLMQSFFKYSASLCGLPSITLQGTKEDWKKLEEKAQRLQEWGQEPAEYARVLAPILSGFVRTFENPDSEETKTFWSQFIMGKRERGQFYNPDTNIVTGWITGFNFWKPDGSLLISREDRQKSNKGVKLGDVQYVPRDVTQLPLSYVKVPVTLDKKDMFLLAGNIGIHRTTIHDDESNRDLVSAEPMSGWYLVGPFDGKRQYTRPAGMVDNELGKIGEYFKACPNIYSRAVIFKA